jgi:hypothetical protein
MGFAKGSTILLLADLPPRQIKSGHVGCGKSTRRANHFGLSEIVSSPEIKNISVFA